MRITLVGRGGVHTHAPSRALLRELASAGVPVEVREHERGPRLGDRVAALLPGRRGAPTAVVPATRGDVPLALAVAGEGGHVIAPPAWGLPPDRDLAWAAPHDAALSSSSAGPGVGHHLAPAAAAAPGTTPRDGRHAGRSLLVVARWSATTPARYLTAACERAGIDVRRREELDWDEAAGVDAVLVVESPLPALPVTGVRRDVPVLLWAHHGEHHTSTQLRLVRHYAVDAVLLAHSWHLAHRFPRPVHRFPFGVPRSLVDGGMPFDQRPLDAAFVGAGIEGGGAYARRGRLLASLRAALGDDRVAFETGRPPERVAALYGSARLVPNDCGSRHRPITMRVLEAVGAGAVLLTDDAPGLDRLLDPDGHHVVVHDPVGEQARALLADPGLADRAAAATAHARGHHTTDHRVDELLAIVEAATVAPPLPTPPTVSEPLLEPIAGDLLLDDVLPLGLAAVEEQLPDRVVWEQDRIERLDDRPLAHAVVVGADWRGDPATAVRAARRLVVAPQGRADVVEAALASSPTATRRRDDHVVAVDLGTPGYRLEPGGGG